MYLVPSYVGTQIWGTASHHVLLLSSRKSCLMTSRGKLVHWWGSWEGAGGPGRAAAARRRRHRPPVRRPPAPPAGGAGDGGGSAGSARGDGPRRWRGAARRRAEQGAPPLRPAPPPPPAAPGAGREAAGSAGFVPPVRPPESPVYYALCPLSAPGEAIHTSSQTLHDTSSDAGNAYVHFIDFFCLIIFFCPPFFFRTRGFERHPGPADLQWQVAIKDKNRATFFLLGGQIPGGFTAAVIFPHLGKSIKISK